MTNFEGSEKRLEVYFELLREEARGEKPGRSLKALSQSQLDALLADAQCKIISSKKSEICDAYLLSESSFFVYDRHCVLKTCGTTKLLGCVPRLLAYARDLGLKAGHVRFSRASYLFPKEQPAPHNCFTEEVALLKACFPDISKTCNAYVLGDVCHGLQWHFFVAGSKPLGHCASCLEVCMTGLSCNASDIFSQGSSFVSARQTTCDSGIIDLIPGANIDDFMFWPCGYSMNGLFGSGFVTIHVTPEEGCSYASVEFMGFHAKDLPLERVMSQLVKIFEPRNLYIAMTMMKGSSVGFVGEECIALQDYICHGFSTQSYQRGMKTIFGSFGFQHHVPNTSIASIDSMSSSELSEEALEPKLDGLICDGDANDGCSTLGVMESLYNVERIPSSSVASIDSYARKLINNLSMEKTFYILDLSIIKRLYALWKERMPRVTPFYAVKCNPDPGIISLLSSLGAGFDCASENEARLVASLGVPPSKVLLANACKQLCDIRSMKAMGVSITTFDTESELLKLHKMYPECQLLLRIRADDPDARCQLGNKYGADVEQVSSLLATAKALDMQVIGISFHVGSGAKNPCAFGNALYHAYQGFQEARALGFEMKVLDIGGGFCSGQADNANLATVATVVNAALDTYFPDGSKMTIVAEPGRYFAEPAATLLTSVFGCRERVHDSGTIMRDYWITDGIYGSFNCVFYDHATVVPRALKLNDDETRDTDYLSTLFGPTCDGMDLVVSDVLMPKLHNGDWVAFSNMGAYTLAGACHFNGMDATSVDVFYVWSDQQ